METRKIVFLAIAAVAGAAHAEQSPMVGVMEEIVVTIERPTPPAMEEVVVTARGPAATQLPTDAYEHQTALENEIRAQLRDYAHATQPNLLF